MELLVPGNLAVNPAMLESLVYPRDCGNDLFKWELSVDNPVKAHSGSGLIALQ